MIISNGNRENLKLSHGILSDLYKTDFENDAVILMDNAFDGDTFIELQMMLDFLKDISEKIKDVDD